MQTARSTLITRALALGEAGFRDVGRVIWRETGTPLRLSAAQAAVEFVRSTL